MQCLYIVFTTYPPALSRGVFRDLEVGSSPTICPRGEMRRIGARKVATLVTVSVCALLAGVRLGWRDLAAFAKDLSVVQMAALGPPREGRPRRDRPTGETTCSPTRTAGGRSGPPGLAEPRAGPAIRLATRWRLTARRPATTTASTRSARSPLDPGARPPGEASTTPWPPNRPGKPSDS